MYKGKLGKGEGGIVLQYLGWVVLGNIDRGKIGGTETKKITNPDKLPLQLKL